MTCLPRWPARFARLAALASFVALVAGCESEEPSPTVDTSVYTPMTKGSAQDLMDHVGRLTKRYVEAESPDPAAARALLLAYTSAVIGTTEAVLADKTADPEIREQAAGTLMTALKRRRQADPTALETLISTSERVERDNPKTRIAALVAFERCAAIGIKFQATPVPDRPAKIKEIADAVDHVGRMTPPPAIAPELLNKTARDAEAYKRPEEAARLYTTLIERFPEDERVPFAKGALERMKLMGKVLEELQGPGRDGKTTSLKDYRGKVVLIDFWATFCVPCAREIPELESFRKSMEPEGFVLLGVCLDPRREEGEAFIKEVKLEWPQIFSPIKNEKMESEMNFRFGIQGLPYKMVIDRDGKLVASGHYLEDVKPAIESLLGVKKDPATAKPAEEKPGKEAAPKS